MILRTLDTLKDEQASQVMISKKILVGIDTVTFPIDIFIMKVEENVQVSQVLKKPLLSSNKHGLT